MGDKGILTHKSELLMAGTFTVSGYSSNLNANFIYTLNIDVIITILGSDNRVAYQRIPCHRTK